MSKISEVFLSREVKCFFFLYYISSIVKKSSSQKTNFKQRTQILYLLTHYYTLLFIFTALKVRLIEAIVCMTRIICNFLFSYYNQFLSNVCSLLIFNTITQLGLYPLFIYFDSISILFTSGKCPLNLIFLICPTFEIKI